MHRTRTLLPWLTSRCTSLLGAPAAFAAAAIREGNKLLGVLAVQLPNEAIDSVVSGNSGWESKNRLGESGDSGIVGPDYLLNSMLGAFCNGATRRWNRCAKEASRHTR